MTILTLEQQTKILKKIGEELRKPNVNATRLAELDKLLAKVIDMELPEEDHELVGQWEKLNREQ